MCDEEMRLIFVRLIIFFVFILTKTRAKAAVEHEECRQFFDANDCYYLPCLDAHYPCGRSSHLVKFGYNLCQLSTVKYGPKMTKVAQMYFNRTSHCAMTTIHDRLVERGISSAFTCTQLLSMVFQSYLGCLKIKHASRQLAGTFDFCSIICENLQPMIDLFLNLNDGSVNLNSLLIEVGNYCGIKTLSSETHSIPALLMSICIDREDVKLRPDITTILFNRRFEFNDYDWG